MLSVPLLETANVDSAFDSLVTLAVVLVEVTDVGDGGGAGLMSGSTSSTSESKLSSQSVTELFGSTHVTVDASLS